MRYLKIFFLALPLCFLACCDDDDNHSHEHTHENDHSHDDDHIHEYQDLTLRVFTSHPSLAQQPAQFETVTEQFLLKEAHLMGATFEAVTEQVLSKDAFNRYVLSSQSDIYLVSNDENNSISVLPCIAFVPQSEVMAIEVPAEYATRTYQRVVVQGTGTAIPATYETMTSQRLDIPGQLNTTNGPRSYEDFDFRILEEVSLDDFLADQLSLQGITDCLLMSDYEIL